MILIWVLPSFPAKNSNSPTPRYKRYVDIIGDRANLNIVFLPFFFLDTAGMLEIAVKLLSTIRVTSKVAFASGSSQHGKARIASAASNWVVASSFSLPLYSYLLL